MTSTSPDGAPVVLVTGAGTGIGAATARRLVADGARVALVGRRAGPLRDLEQALLGDARGVALAVPPVVAVPPVMAVPPVVAVPADAADPEAMDAAVASVLDRFGRLDALVANAGGAGAGTAGDADDAAWEAGLRANLLTAVVSVRACLPPLVAARGAVVVVSSIAGLAAPPALAPYTTAKHALIGLMRSIARDYGPSGVRANAVCPGWVRTPMADAEMDDLARLRDLPDRAAAYALATAHVPLRRPVTVDEVASAVAFLIGPDARGISGVVLPVDGGTGAVDLPTIAFEH